MPKQQQQQQHILGLNSIANSIEDYLFRRRAQVLKRMETVFTERPVFKIGYHHPHSNQHYPIANLTHQQRSTNTSNNNKYNVTIDCSDYDVASLKTEITIKNGVLYVSGREENKKGEDGEDYSIKEFKKTYKLPENALNENVTSFFMGKELMIEVPLSSNDDSYTSKKINYSCILPRHVNPNDVKVTFKESELIIKAETDEELFYQTYTCPSNTDLSSLKCELAGNQLNITIPYTNHRQIPIKYI